MTQFSRSQSASSGVQVLVQVINLDRRPDRMVQMAAQLDALGLTWERLSATDGADAKQPHSLPQRTNGPNGVLSVGARACSSSHLRAIQRIVDSGAKYGLVLEDDVELAPDMAEVLADLSWIPAGVEMIKVEKFNGHRSSTLLLGKHALPVGRRGRELRRMLSRHTGSAGYILTAEGARRILAQAHRICVPIDHFLFNDTVSPVARALNPHIVTPGLVRQRRDDVSDVYTLDYQPQKKNRLRSLRRAWAELKGMPRQLLLLSTGQGKLMKVSYAADPGNVLAAER